MHHRLGWLDPVFVALSVVGYGGLVWVALALVLPLVMRRPLVPVALATAVAVWSVDLLVTGLKDAFDRVRPFRAIAEAPDPLLQFTVGHSLPSGHAATSFAGAVVLAYYFRRLAPWLVLLAAGVAFSRVYVGVHYPFDVLLGSAIGALWGGLVLLGVRELGRRRALWAYSKRAP